MVRIVIFFRFEGHGLLARAPVDFVVAATPLVIGPWVGHIALFEYPFSPSQPVLGYRNVATIAQGPNCLSLEHVLNHAKRDPGGDVLRRICEKLVESINEPLRAFVRLEIYLNLILAIAT